MVSHNWLSVWQPNDNQMAPQDKLREDKVSEDKISQDKTSNIKGLFGDGDTRATVKFISVYF